MERENSHRRSAREERYFSYSFTHIALCNLCGSMRRPNKRGRSWSAARTETRVSAKLWHPLLSCMSGQEGDEATRGTHVTLKVASSPSEFAQGRNWLHFSKRSYVFKRIRFCTSFIDEENCLSSPAQLSPAKEQN